MQLKQFISKIIHEEYKKIEQDDSEKQIELIHITTPKNADEIKKNGFQPKQFIDYKYYSKLGKDGIYFYDNKRQAQFYAGFLMGKAKIDRVAMIFVTAPLSIVTKSETMEDGYFIPTENLEFIKINNIKIVRYSEIY